MYIYESRIGFSESDSKGNLSLTGLLNYFQDVATFQSEDLGVGWNYIHQLDMVWVLSSWQLVINRYPRTCEVVEIGTFPYAFKGCFGYRNFVMRTKEGEILAMANSLWTLLSTKDRGIGRFTEKMKEVYEIEPRLEMEYKDRRIRVPEGGSYSLEYKITSHHLDSNKHVNNGKYIELAMDELPAMKEIKNLRAEYKKQAFLGDTVCPYLVRKDGLFVVALRNSSGEDFAVVEFEMEDGKTDEI